MSALQCELLTTVGCHLCDDALRLLAPYIEAQIVALEEIDIAECDHLLEDYAVKIPVVRHRRSGLEICWPFDEQSVHKYLESVAAVTF